ncbi:glycosyltransferase family 2 protein [Pseudoduganella namucuonensis]|nr:glycosyltransferase family 2 protein [Pseudoduganella namucuonensis]
MPIIQSASALINRGEELLVPGAAPNSADEAQRCAEAESPCGVSIIVPTRNRPALLARALQSILSQSYRAFEVIVIDDSSTADVRQAYAQLWDQLDPRFILRCVGEAGGAPLGPSVTRNLGIAAASGTIVTFCDDDDFWTDDGHLETAAATFAARPSLDMYIANQTAVSTNGAVVMAEWLPGLVGIMRGKERADRQGYLVTVAELTRGGGFAQLNILALRTTTARAIGGFWTRTTYEEDRDFYWRAADAAREICFNPTIIGQHNIPDHSRQSNLSSSFSQVERWSISVLVSQHIAINTRDHAIKALCLGYEGDIWRHLSLHFSEQGNHTMALQYARRALAARASIKWTGYTILLMVRSILRRLTP